MFPVDVAYGHFIEGMNYLRDSLKLEDENLRNAGIENARSMLRHALADYNNPQLCENTNSAGQLRRRECAWAIDQAITTTYHLQGEYEVVSDRLSQLQDKIRRDSLAVIDNCETESELNFLFPEITRIHNHDLAVLESWQNQVDWVQTLTPDDRQLLASSDMTGADSTRRPGDTAVVAEPKEELLYNNLKQKSHFLSLRDQIKFLVNPDLRQIHSDYISQQATASGYKALAPSNWQEISDLTVANLYWYFRKKDRSQQ